MLAEIVGNWKAAAWDRRRKAAGRDRPRKAAGWDRPRLSRCWIWKWKSGAGMTTFVSYHLAWDLIYSDLWQIHITLLYMLDCIVCFLTFTINVFHLIFRCETDKPTNLSCLVTHIFIDQRKKDKKKSKFMVTCLPLRFYSLYLNTNRISICRHNRKHGH